MLPRPLQRDLFGRRAPTPHRAPPTTTAPGPAWGRILRRRGWALALAVGLSLGAAWTACAGMQPVYQATASVEAQRPVPPVRFAGDVPPPPAPDAAELQTRAEELGSRAVIAAALKRMPPPEAEALPLRFWRRPRWLPPRPLTAAQRLQATTRQLAIMPASQGRFIQLRFRAPSPALAAEFLRLLVAADLRRAQAGDQAIARARVDFVAGQTEAARVRMQAAQAGLESWTAQHGLADPAAQLALATQRWQQLAQAQTAAAIAGWEQADALSAGARSAPPGFPGGDAYRPSAPTDLEVKRAETQAEVSRLAAIYQPQAAPLLQAQQELASLDASLASLRAQDRVERQRSLAAAQTQAQDLARAVARQARTQATLRQALGGFDLAQRDLQADQTVYSGLLDQLQQAVAEAGPTALPLRLADPAVAAERPLEPYRPAALAYALVLGGLLGFAAMGLLEATDDRVRLPEAAALEVPLVAWLPPLRTPPATAPHPEIVRGLESCVAALLLAQGEADTRIVYVTSVGGGEGKTTVALHLAQALAQAAPAVLLLDGNPHRPALHQALGGEAAPGLAELLAGHATVEQALRQVAGAGGRGLFYIPAGDSGSAPSLAVGLASGAGAELLAAARRRYPWIVVDGGPAFAGPEAGIWSSLADCCLLVAACRRTSRRRLQQALQLVAASGVAACGLVLNRAPEARRAALPAVWLAAPSPNGSSTVTPMRQSA